MTGKSQIQLVDLGAWQTQCTSPVAFSFMVFFSPPLHVLVSCNPRCLPTTIIRSLHTCTAIPWKEASVALEFLSDKKRLSHDVS